MSAVWTQLQTRQDSFVLFRQEQTRQFGLVSSQFPISKFSVIFNIFETGQLQIGNWVETRQNCLALSPIVFTPPTRTRQHKTVLSCPCRRRNSKLHYFYLPATESLLWNTLTVCSLGIMIIRRAHVLHNNFGQTVAYVGPRVGINIVACNVHFDSRSRSQRPRSNAPQVMCRLRSKCRPHRSDSASLAVIKYSPAGAARPVACVLY